MSREILRTQENMMKYIILLLSTITIILYSASSGWAQSWCHVKITYSDLSPYVVAAETTHYPERLLFSHAYEFSDGFDFTLLSGVEYSDVHCPDFQADSYQKCFNEKLKSNSTRFKLYAHLLSSAPASTFKALLLRRNFIHPKIALLVRTEVDSFRDAVSHVDPNKLMYLWSNVYAGFFDEDLASNSSDTGSRELICERLQGADRFSLSSSDQVYLPFFEARFLTLPEVLASQQERRHEEFAKFYYETLCLEKPYSVCLTKEARLFAKPDCSNSTDVFGVQYLPDKDVIKVFNNLEELPSEVEKQLALSLFSINGVQVNSIDHFSLKEGLELFALDLDYLYAYERIFNLMKIAGLEKDYAIFYFLGDHHVRYSKSYILPFAHGNFFYNRGNPFQLSPIRAVREASCLSRAIYSFALIAPWYEDAKFQYRLIHFGHSKFQQMGHAWVKFTSSDKKCYLVDNDRVYSCDRVFQVPMSSAARFLRDKNPIEENELSLKDLPFFKNVVDFLQLEKPLTE